MVNFTLDWRSRHRHNSNELKTNVECTTNYKVTPLTTELLSFLLSNSLTFLNKTTIHCKLNNCQLTAHLEIPNP